MKATFEHDANRISTLRDMPLISLENYRLDVQAKMMHTIRLNEAEGAGNYAAILFGIRREIERRELWVALADAAEELRSAARA